ncbi:MAG: YifB family Mg chelatase-like AAA ATPase [Alphaproteobacteria bacterium]|jgi:magnesium chelatase family protein|nr:YifB family Mg chelatase-like AAA ATPase [Alphaproteobacteria bacterium]
MDIEFASSYTLSLNGLDAKKIIVQAHIASGLPVFNIVGLADKAVSESKERIRAALSSIAFALPAKRITINLAPANLMKEGSHFDLAITLTILAALKIFPEKKIKEYLISSELSLDGSLNRVNGILPTAILANKLNKGLICAKENLAEAAISGNKNIASFSNLLEVINFFRSDDIVIASNYTKPKMRQEESTNFKDIIGLKEAKRAFEIAAVGKHNILMIGAPGSGKSMLASAFKSILPDLTNNELLETAIVKSVVQEHGNNDFFSFPFRSPHHNCSAAALTGGGSKITPGEITKAHNGILFLDELPEYRRDALESLRQPLEEKKITISRAGKSVTYPANFQLISAMNPCKCGYLQIAGKRCGRAPICKDEYQKKLSGPLLERIDIIITIPHKKTELFKQKQIEESSFEVKERVIKARTRQQESLIEIKKNYSSELTLEDFKNYINITDHAKELLQKASDKYQLSMRNNLRILRLAKTISDMDNNNVINDKYLFEALKFKTNF